MTKNTKIILGIAGAVAAGAIIGLMLAPEKGSDLRRKMKDKAADLADQLGDLVAKGKGEIASLKNKAMREANGLKNKAEEKFDFENA